MKPIANCLALAMYSTVTGLGVTGYFRAVPDTRGSKRRENYWEEKTQNRVLIGIGKEPHVRTAA
jgi:hypothetical protein